MSTQDIKITIAEYFKTQPVLKAWLFGSFAREEQRDDSDIDILVEFDHSQPIGLFAYARMWRELKEKLGRDVDLVEEGTMRPLIAEDANSDRQLIYERAIKIKTDFSTSLSALIMLVSSWMVKHLMI